MSSSPSGTSQVRLCQDAEPLKSKQEKKSFQAVWAVFRIDMS